MLVVVGLYLVLALEATGGRRPRWVGTALRGAARASTCVVLAFPGVAELLRARRAPARRVLMAAVGSGLSIGFLWLTDDRFVPRTGQPAASASATIRTWPSRQRRRSTPSACARTSPFLEELVRRQAARVSRLRLVDAEAAAGARRDAGLLRALVRERPPRRLPARRARDRGVRGRPPQGGRVRQRALRARGDLHPQRDRGDQPRRLRVGARQPRPGRRRRRHGARAPRELRPLAVHREPHRRGFRHIPIDDTGELQLDALDALAREGNVKVVANGLVSNSLGTINPVERLAAWAHEQGAIMVVDAAQAAPHRRVDVQALGCDFLAISSHKLCGPSGVGALWGRRELLEAMAPFNLGGEMIRSVALEQTTFNELPHKFEAGTPAIAEAVGFGAAIDYSHGDRPRRDRAARARARSRYAMDTPRRARLRHASTARRPTGARASSRSTSRACIRTTWRRSSTGRASPSARGHHCTQPLMTRLGVAATTRASFYLYSIPEEIDRLVDGPAARSQKLARDERVRAAVPRGDPRPLQEPAEPRAARAGATRSRRGRTRSAATR